MRGRGARSRSSWRRPVWSCSSDAEEHAGDRPRQADPHQPPSTRRTEHRVEWRPPTRRSAASIEVGGRELGRVHPDEHAGPPTSSKRRREPLARPSASLPDDVDAAARHGRGRRRGRGPCADRSPASGVEGVGERGAGECRRPGRACRAGRGGSSPGPGTGSLARTSDGGVGAHRSARRSGHVADRPRRCPRTVPGDLRPPDAGRVGHVDLLDPPPRVRPRAGPSRGASRSARSRHPEVDEVARGAPRASGRGRGAARRCGAGPRRPGHGWRRQRAAGQAAGAGARRPSTRSARRRAPGAATAGDRPRRGSRRSP